MKNSFINLSFVLLLLSISFLPFSAFATASGLRVNFPNGGESLEQGNIYPLQWSPIAGEEVSLSLVAGEKVFPIAKVSGRLANSGMYLWTVPSNLTLAADYQLLVVGENSSDSSDATFSIIGKSVSDRSKVNQMANILQILENLIKHLK